MNLTFKINNRDAISVRAIPFVTGWTMSPDVVAKNFARSDHWTTKLLEIKTYQYEGMQKFSLILPKEWDGILIELEYLSGKWQMDKNFHGGNYVEWRKDSIPVLPPKCFVWKDEFETAFKKAYSKDKLILIDERDGERELNYSPLVPQSLQEKVLQGFEEFFVETDATKNEKSLSTTERESLLKLILVMAMAGYKYDPKEKRNSATTEITEDLQKFGLALDQDTVRKYLDEARAKFNVTK